MRLALPIIISFLIISHAGMAQKNEFNALLFGGLVASQLDGDTYSGFNKAGFTAGAAINRYFNKKLMGQMGLSYSQKGSKYTNKSGAYYKSQLHYLELPLTLRYYHYKKFDLEAGLSFGYLLQGLEDLDGYGLMEPTLPFNSFELGTIIGLNYSLSQNLDLGMHYCYSATTVRPYSSGYERFMDKGQHNNLFTFYLGYKLSLK